MGVGVYPGGADVGAVVQAAAGAAQQIVEGVGGPGFGDADPGAQLDLVRVDVDGGRAASRRVV